MVLQSAQDGCDSVEDTTDTLLPTRKESKDEVVKIRFTKSKDIVPYLLSGALGAGFFAMGFSLNILGLTLPTLAENVMQHFEDVSPILIARGGGYLAGSLLIGLLERKVDIHILTMISLMIMGIGIAVTPLVLNVIVLYVSTCVSAIGIGALETVGCVLCLQLWGKRAEPVLQFLHFWFCFGSAMTPFLTKPFINEVSHTNATSLLANSSSVNEFEFRNITYILDTSIPYVSVPYFIFAVFVLLIVIFMVILKTCTSLKQSESQQENTIKQEGTTFRYGMLFLLFMFFFVYVGMEVTFSTFLYTFAVSDKPGLAYSKDVGTDLSAVFLFSIVIGQFFAIFMSKKFTPKVILRIDFCGVTLSTVAILLYPVYADVTPEIFWIAIVVCGLFSTSIYATSFTWAERYITVNGRAACIFIIGGSLGEMILPIPVGQLIVFNPLTFLYFVSAFVFAMLLLFIVMSKVASTKGKRHVRDNLKSATKSSISSRDAVWDEKL